MASGFDFEVVQVENGGSTVRMKYQKMCLKTKDGILPNTAWD